MGNSYFGVTHKDRMVKGKSSPHEGVTRKGESSSVELDHKFKGHMRADEHTRENPFTKVTPSGTNIGNGYTEKDYGSVKAVYKDKGTSKAFHASGKKF